MTVNQHCGILVLQVELLCSGTIWSASPESSMSAVRLTFDKALEKLKMSKSIIYMSAKPIQLTFFSILFVAYMSIYSRASGFRKVRRTVHHPSAASKAVRHAHLHSLRAL
ncbi:hypothetical protein CPB84DRAFT_1321274 [Gymnopilus junonius]|uniref:Uncharacterized protein n=1 Tax=Gymnopilus junonius TaxID=109634 RepID=A0A9P5TM94_GYMJU|nr:hypothetical protein CPB84DRAFT_1321274 [Gymnopilus junonius]